MWPASLKNRLFLTFLLIMFVPLTAIFFYTFREIEATLQDKMIDQSAANLSLSRQRFDDMLSILTKAFLIVEKDTTIASILQDPSQFSDLERRQMTEEKIRSIENSLFLYHSPQVFYTVADFHGNLYSSFKPRRKLDYRSFMMEYEFTAEFGQAPYRWITNDANDVSMDISKSPYLLSLLGVMMDGNNRPIGIARLSLDYQYWFLSTIWHNTASQHYSLISREGDVLVHSHSGQSIPSTTVNLLKEAMESSGYFVDQSSSQIVVYSYIPTLDWYLISSISQDHLFAEVALLKRRYFALFCIFAVLFALIIFYVSLRITRPLNKLSRKMAIAVNNQFEGELAVTGQKGEVAELTRAFNQMINDMKIMMGKLKEEQIQKESVRFQMLLSQMNPHFLFNTLNTIKWIALRNGNDDIGDICVSLGKLLETSLSSEIELIHLKDELELLNHYVSIQQFRFNFNFDIQYEYSSNYAYALVPKLSLQPLIENAIYHGFQQIQEDAKIVVRVYADVQNLVIEVEDNGKGLQSRSAYSTGTIRKGIGISNLRERISILFKQQANLEIIALSPGVMVRLTLPLLMSNPYDKEVAQLVDSTFGRR